MSQLLKATSSRTCRAFAAPRPSLLRVRSVRAANANQDSNVATEAPKPAPVEEVPIWVRREQERQLQAAQGDKKELPWGLYLLGSTLTAIAAVGCIFEYVDRNAFFGIIQPDSPVWAPILLTLAVTGFPTAGFLFIKGVNGFNEAAERQDKLDGYLD